MCGIAGVFRKGINPKPISIDISSMLEMIQHRGPDDEGSVIINDQHITSYSKSINNSNIHSLPYLKTKEFDNNAQGLSALGHTRLSILDLSPLGHQPMSDETGRYWITYNGEIYNYIEIREKLITQGIQIFSDTDTEVVLKSFIFNGRDCIEEFNGMWSFCIYDNQKKELFCSRDRVGVKPFYYLNNDQVFAFASEIKPLLRLIGQKPSIDQSEFSDLFVSGKMGRSDKTLFKEIKELMPSNNLIFNLKNGVFKTQPYYEPFQKKCEEFTSSQDINETAKELNEKITKAIQIRLRSDVEVGVCLSGGLDSSAIIGHLSQMGVSQKRKTFTATQVGEVFDESTRASKVSDYFSCEWFPVSTNENELLDSFDDIIKTHELPILSLSTFAQYKVMSKVSDAGVKVVLDGQGADEMFGGYPHHRSFLAYSFFRTGAFKKLSDLLNKSSESFSNNRALRDLILFNFSHLLGNKRISLITSRIKEIQYVNSDTLSHTLNSQTTNTDNSRINSFNDILLKEYYGGYLKDLLRYEDRNSMRFGVESRTVFADDINLMDWFFKIPKQNFFKNGFSKFLFRQSLKNNLPKDVLWRKDKVGFQVPNNKWMWELSKVNKDLVANLPRDLFNVDKIMNNYDSIFDQRNKQENFRTLKYLSFAKWYDQFIRP